MSEQSDREQAMSAAIFRLTTALVFVLDAADIDAEATTLDIVVSNKTTGDKRTIESVTIRKIIEDAATFSPGTQAVIDAVVEHGDAP